MFRAIIPAVSSGAPGGHCTAGEMFGSRHKVQRSAHSLRWPALLTAATLLSMLLTTACSGTPASPSPTAASRNTDLPSFASVVNQVIPSIVYIYVETNNTDNKGSPVAATGSGIILRSDGYILTNRHVVADAKTVQVTLYDRRSYEATRVIADDVIDLAVVKINERDLTALPLGNPDAINVGDWVIAIGHALGMPPEQGGPTVTDGIVSSLGRSFSINDISYYDLVQTSAAINPGNSGGALVNLAGELVGVNSADVSGAQNIGFAINVGTAGHIFNDIVQYGKANHPFLGTRLRDITPDISRQLNLPVEGALVDYVEPGSPAESAGLRVDDVITELGGEPVKSAADLIKVLWRHNAGDTVTIVYSHRGLEHQQTITLADRPQTDAV